MSATRLLLVEDDTGIGRMLERGLGAEGYAVEWARSLRDAVAAARSTPPEVVLLDRMLPDGDGAELCRALRRMGSGAMVLMLTARDGLDDKLSGFDAGADDYLAKPFEFEELLARLAALRRRAAGPPAPDLALDPETRTLRVGPRRARFTPREWPLIARLAESEGRPVGRAELIAAAWGSPEAVSSNALDVYVGYLRRRLSEVEAPARIEAVRGRGFMLTFRAPGRPPGSTSAL